ncbi:DUF456 domain-containing protein [Flavobacterium dankookense]|uniref:DUF456 domain-containing protein n=1 Tax=Flavobacterium dankookense TaxID=706186 RepID=A0A4R6QA07_9FLAO|nr:DUF456 domain-containing protein [Flavobacterium dankookense]TDP58716.1 hypothetical protein BC748_1946 [Flavobacterium dankookense]
MDVLLLIVGFVLMILGLIGSFLPVLPGVPLSWLGLLLLYFTEKIQSNYWVLGITLIITIIVTILDYVIPAKGTKKFGGTKYGIWGTNIGLILGLFFPPIGFIVGTFVGAFVGEILNNSSDTNGALKAATGSFIGFLVSTFMKFMVCLSFLLLYLFIAVKNFI